MDPNPFTSKGILENIRDLLKGWLDDKTYTPNSTNTDQTGRESQNTIFGEAIVGQRKPAISNQFMYGADTRFGNDSIWGAGVISITDDSLATGESGAQTESGVILQTKQVIRYAPGYQCYMDITILFSEGKAGSGIEVGLDNGTDGFWIGYKGDVFGFMRLRAGVEDWHPASTWDVDVLTGDNIYNFTLNPQAMNLYRVTYGYLGVAPVSLEILIGRKWVMVHDLQFANVATKTHIANTYLPIRGTAFNTTNDTNVYFKVGSVCAGIVDGVNADISARPFSLTLPEKVTGTNTVLGTFRSKSTFATKTNQIPVKFNRVSISSDGNKNVTIQMFKNMTITNSPTYADVDSDNSTIDYATDATVTVGTGWQVIAFEVAKIENFIERIDDLDIVLYPGETLTIIANGTNSVKTSFNWKELF